MASDKLSRIISVNSLAKPIPQTLLAARTTIRVRPDLQDLFKKARAEKWTSDALADALFICLPEYLESTENLWDTALYLADEFFQFGDQVLLVSTETGKAICKITEDDIYIPAPTRREGQKGLAQPLPRLKPDLEGFLINWQFTESRDQQILQTLTKRVPSSELLVQEGDNRLLRATRTGRKRLAEIVREELPLLLPPKVGIAKEFFDLCYFEPSSENDPTDLESLSPERAIAKVVVPVVDPLAFNLQQDPLTTIKHQIMYQWVRAIARSLANFVNNKVQALEASVLESLPPSFWITTPNTAMALRGKKVLSVLDVPTVFLHPWEAPIIYLWIRSDSYNCQSYELLDRWEIIAECEFTLRIKLKACSLYHLTDVPLSGLSIEVLA